MAFPPEFVLQELNRLTPGVRRRDAGGPKGYICVYGPSVTSITDPEQCWLKLERQRRTIALADPVATHLAAASRPMVPIAEDDLGWSVREGFGRFGQALSPAMIDGRWTRLSDLAQAIIDAFRATSTPW